MIADNAITLAKMAGLARGKIIVGNSSGDPSALTIGSANTILKSDGSDASWGNVTTDMIADNAITLAKMAGLARGKIIVGNSSGDPSALTIGSANTILKSDGSDASWGNVTTDMIADNSVNLAKMAGLARGKIIVGNSSGDPSALASGSNGKILVANDNGDPSWTSLSGDAELSAGVLTVSSSQTNIESITNNSLVMGRDADNQIKFSTDNQIIFRVNGGDNVIFKENGDTVMKGTTTLNTTEYLNSNVMKYSQHYFGNSSPSYFSNGEYQKVLTIIPSDNSLNYHVQCKISVQSAQNFHHVYINAGLRSNTLPNLDWKIYYDEEYNNTRFIDPLLWTKETTTAGFILAFKALQTIYGMVTCDITVVPRFSNHKSDISINTLKSSEQSSIDSGYTSNNMVKVISKSGSNVNIGDSSGVITAGGFTTTGTWTFDSSAGGGATVGIQDVQPSTASFGASNVTLMTAAAIQDKIDSYAGSGLTLSSNNFDVSSSQTSISSIYNTSLSVGRSSTQYINFGSSTAIRYILNNSGVANVKYSMDLNALFVQTGTADLGKTTNRWSNVYLAEDSAINYDGGMALTHNGSGSTLNLTGASSGGFTCDGDITAFKTSDKRLKDNIVKIENPIEKIKRIGGYNFEWNELGEENTNNKGKDIGLIAQEVEEVLPEATTTRENGYKAVQYEKVIPLLIESIKQQQIIIEDLQGQLDELKNKII